MAITGPESVGAIQYLESIRRGLPNKVTAADIKVAERLSRELKKRIPVRTGALRESVRVLGRGRNVAVGYKKTPYTLPVNADINFIENSIKRVAPMAEKLWKKDVQDFIRKRNRRTKGKRRR